MSKYFATFVSGAQDIIGVRLAKFGNAQLKVEDLQDGLVVFDSTLTANQLSELRFFNNVYNLLASDPQGDLPIPQLDTPGTFIVRVKEASQPVAVPEQIVNRVAKQTGLTPTAHNPNHAFLLWQRQNGQSLWGLALPKAGFKLRHLEAGEIRPELAHILGLVAGLDPKDTVLDPFAGYGGIVRECLQGFHCETVIAVEHNEQLIPHLKSIPRLVALHGDAGSLPHIETRGVDRVVTDPPWGDFSNLNETQLRHLYHGALVQMHRVLRTKGAAVILTSAAFLPELAAECAFDVIKQYPILVSGKKATIYKLRKY